MDSLAFISEVCAPLHGKRVIDIGCGPGLLALALSTRGALVTGVDPSAEAIAAARTCLPEGSFHEAGAAALPFEAATFEAAVFLNSLHHVPAEEMLPALREALRVVTRTGRVVVIEPLASGDLFELLLQVEDETLPRAMAQEAVQATVWQGLARMERQVDYERVDLYAGFDQFSARIASADRSRETALRERARDVREAFERLAVRQGSMFALTQPMRAHALAPPRASPGEVS